MALYPKALPRLIRPGVNDPRITPKTVVLHVDAMNADRLDGWFTNPAAGGVESHFHVRLDGTVDQYRDTNYQADAQPGGAAQAVSIETQGRGDGEWTPAQLATIKALIVWLARVHPGIKLRPPRNPFDAGVGYHSQWPSSMEGTWARDGRTCPGPRRIAQYRTILLPWMAALSAPPPPAPAPAPTPTPRRPATMLVKVKDADPVWVTDGITRRHLPNPAALADLKAALKAAGAPASALVPLEVPTEARARAAFGPVTA